MPRKAIQQSQPSNANNAQVDVVTRRSRVYLARQDFNHRCEILRQRLGQEDFLANRGIGNEIGFFTFCYDPALELDARAFVAQLQQEGEQGKLPCNLIVRNLYDVVLQVLEDKRILRAVPRREEKIGPDKLAGELSQRVCPPDVVAQALDYGPHAHGDVLLLTGVGEVYPLLRAHDLLNNMLTRFDDLPVVLMYPGTFTGQSFSLFNTFPAADYYRAIDIS